jgi:2-C-methyl-D-erythritol 4-phosphate cytidylyltransferase / 2-C-methyl-D-erythritol 2,4-cyclodiphosphate synthase
LKGVASSVFLTKARDLVAERTGRITHCDVTLICETPKIGPHREKMRAALAAVLRIEDSRISVKATTTEQLGFTGRREGIAAMATATIALPVQQ